ENFVIGMRTAAGEWRAGEQKERLRWNLPQWIAPRWIAPRWIPAFAALGLLLLAAVLLPRFTGNSQPPLAVSLAATRGEGMNAVVPAGRSLALTPDLTGLPTDSFYRLEIVDANGAGTWRGRYTAGQDAARVVAQRPGDHFV